VHVDNVITMRTALPWPKYEGQAARDRFYMSVLSGVRAIPGIQSAAYISGLPMAMKGGIWPVVTNDAESVRNASNTASLRIASPQYFATLGIPLRQGRDLEDTDTPERPVVAVVSESFVKRHWPNEPALGKHFNFALKDRVVVGVVGDVRVRGLEQTSEPQVYVSYRQQDSASLIFYTPKDLLVRSSATSATSASVLRAVRNVVRAADPLQPISDVRTMEEVVANETASRVAQLRVLGILAAIALLLSGIGIHGLLSFTVSRRSREIGVRVALGAQSGQVARMVLREGAVLAVAGLIPGVAIAYAAGRAMESVLAGVTPGDPWTFTIAVVLCGATAILGCLRPARRAASVDPMTAMRAE
jgi:predicted permease